MTRASTLALAVVALCGVAAARAAAEDVVTLRGGTVLRGTVRSRDAAVLVVVAGGREFRVSREAVLSEEHVRPPVDEELLRRFATGERPERAAAAAELVRRWPESSSTLDAALVHCDSTVRTEAVRLLASSRIDAADERVRVVLRDEFPNVRAAAVRVVRHRKLDGFEPELIRLLKGDAVVAAESLRALEDLGTAACLRAVLAEWEWSRDEVRRRRCMRVLRRITGADHGDDSKAWRAEIERKLRPQESAAKETAAAR